MRAFLTTARHTSAPLPVHVITGALGVGKTSAIARLLATKPADEYWVVILNEFTDAGLDTLTLASAARGAYDVTLVPGGCLCCVGELDFRRRLHALLRERRPHRLLIEPSGLGHPGGVLEELRALERGGATRLMSVVTLVDTAHLHAFDTPGVEHDQIEAADVLLLAKADAVDERVRAEFFAKAQSLFPPRRWIGVCEHAALPPEALAPPPATYTFAIPSTPHLHIATREHHTGEHVHAPKSNERRVQWDKHSITARAFELLDRHACAWLVPPELTFNRAKLMTSLAQRPHVERLKAALRTGVEHWSLFNVSLSGVTCDPSGWRQDSRIEVQLEPGVSADWLEWDAYWLDALV